MWWHHNETVMRRGDITTRPWWDVVTSQRDRDETWWHHNETVMRRGDITTRPWWDVVTSQRDRDETWWHHNETVMRRGDITTRPWWDVVTSQRDRDETWWHHNETMMRRGDITITSLIPRLQERAWYTLFAHAQTLHFLWGIRNNVLHRTNSVSQLISLFCWWDVVTSQRDHDETWWHHNH